MGWCFSSAVLGYFDNCVIIVGINPHLQVIQDFLGLIFFERVDRKIMCAAIPNP